MQHNTTQTATVTRLYNHGSTGIVSIMDVNSVFDTCWLNINVKDLQTNFLQTSNNTPTTQSLLPISALSDANMHELEMNFLQTTAEQVMNH